MKRSKKGFTLAELLIVVAIIAVLVAIAIPVFGTQLEKSRNAADAANLRASYAEAMVNMMTNEEDSTATTPPMQSKDGTAIKVQPSGTFTVTKGAAVTVTVKTDGTVTYA